LPQEQRGAWRLAVANGRIIADTGRPVRLNGYTFFVRGTAVWVRICQHIDGWIDRPKVLRARVSTPAA
jgi:hypothetical protein